MARVYYVPEEDMWVHADTGNKIRGWDVRNTEPHRSELERRGALQGSMFSKTSERIAGPGTQPGTIDPNEGTVPIPPENTRAEEEYIEEILTTVNYA